MANNPNDNTGVFRLDAVSLDATAQTLDPEMRERFLWLGAFLREECNRDLNLLTDAFKAQGVDHDRTTWSKILRGRWKRNAKGEELPSPILSVTSFNDAVDALREKRRVEEMRGKVGFIKTSTWESFKRYIDLKRAVDRVNKFGVIVGPTGSQKTACRREYVRLNNHCQVVGVEAPERFSMYQFLTDLVEAYGGSTKLSYTRKRRFVRECVRSDRTIIIENTQRLAEEKDSRQSLFSFIQKLQDDTGCCVILTFTPEGSQILTKGLQAGYFEQFEGRAGGRRQFLTLPQWTPDEDVLAIARAFKLTAPASHLKYLRDISREPGRIRILFEDLQNAKVLAEAEGKPLTIDHVRSARGED